MKEHYIGFFKTDDEIQDFFYGENHSRKDRVQ